MIRIKKMQMKKNTVSSFIVILLMITAISSCQKGGLKYTYNEEYVMFADSLVAIPVTEDAERSYEIKIGSNKPVDFDVTYPIEIVMSKSTAIEGLHFELLSRNVTIKAGETMGSLFVKSKYSNISFDKDIHFALNVINPRGEKSKLYGSEIKIILKKIKKLNIDDFVGDLRVQALFPFSNTSLVTFYCKSERVSATELRLVDLFFNDKNPFIIKFNNDDNDLFNNEITVKSQMSYTDPNYGAVFIKSTTALPSFYISHDKRFALYLEFYVDKVGTFGSHPVILEWVSPHEVEDSNSDIKTLSPSFDVTNYKLK